MATADQILEVRNNTNTTTADYSDVVVGGLIDDSSVECASAKIWTWEYAKIAKDFGRSIKKAAGGVESHEYNSLKDIMSSYKEQLDYWTEQCRRSQGNLSSLAKATQPSVGGVLTQDQINGDQQ